MALGKRKLRSTVAALAMVSVISTGGLSNIYADSNLASEPIQVEALQNTSYTVKNKVEYIKDGVASDHGVEAIRASIAEDTLIEVINGKTYMTLEFTQKQYDLIDNISMVIDGVTTNFTKSSNRKYRAEIKSLDSKIQLQFNVNIPIPNTPPHSFTTNIILLGQAPAPEVNKAPVITASDLSIYVGDKFDVKSGVKATDEDGDLTNDIKVVSNNVDTTKAGKYTVTYEVSDSKGLKTTKTINVTVLEKEVVKPNALENGTYKIKNKTTYSGNSEIGSSMVRNSLKETSYVEVKDGKVFVTLEFVSDLYKTMENIKITVDGKNVTTTEDKNNAKVTFEVGSINSKVGVSAFITAMGSNINYTLSLEESTLEKVSSSSNGGSSNGTTTDKPSTGGSSNGSNSGSSNSGSSNSGSNSSSSTESTVKKGKLYTIKNTVSHESETGKQMARKYLNSTSKVEEIDGKKYVTLTFTGSEFMKNHAIYVNGSKVSHQVTAKSGDSISLRFKVSDLSDTIKVGMYVVPMSKDIEFTVKLQKDTLTFVKDYEVSEGNGSSLPQTGSAIDSTMTLGAGSALMALAGVLKRRKK